MFEVVLFCGLILPQLIAGIFAKSMGRSFRFWFFISFLIPIVSLIILLFLDDKSEKTGYELADHVKKEGDTAEKRD